LRNWWTKTNGAAVSDELVAKLQSEISMEEDMKEDDDLSVNIKEYLENSPFEVCAVWNALAGRSLPRSRSKTSLDTRKSS
jgi:hypothetical protein